MKLKDFWDFWYGKPLPARVNISKHDDLREASATRGTLIIGDPGSGKPATLRCRFTKDGSSIRILFLFSIGLEGLQTVSSTSFRKTGIT